MRAATAAGCSTTALLAGEREELAAARVDERDRAGRAGAQRSERRHAGAREPEAEREAAGRRDADAQAGERPGPAAADDARQLLRSAPRAREDLVHEDERALRRVAALGARERDLAVAADEAADRPHRRAVEHEREPGGRPMRDCLAEHAPRLLTADVDLPRAVRLHGDVHPCVRRRQHAGADARPLHEDHADILEVRLEIAPGGLVQALAARQVEVRDPPLAGPRRGARP